MDTTWLHSFIIVAECGSFSKAEDIAFISKQALLKQINNLETEVGVRLLVRSGHGVELTAEGRLFLDGAKNMLGALDELVLDCRRSADYRETLRLSNVEHQKLLTPVVNAFICNYPEVTPEYVIHPNHSGEYRVQNGLVDIAETFLDPDFQPAVELTSGKNGVHYTKLADFPYVAVMSRDNPLAACDMLSFSDLAGSEVEYFKFITRNGIANALAEVFADAPELLTVRYDVDNQIAVTFECAASQRILITCNPYIYYMNNVRIVPLESDIRQEYGMITAAEPSPTVQHFADMARFMYKKYGAELVMRRNK